MGRFVACAVVVASAFAAAGIAAENPAPPQLRSGALPRLPGNRVGAGEVLLEVTVDAEGRVAQTRALRATPPYTDRMREAVGAWRFDPALGASGDPVEVKILIAGAFPPAALGGPAPGELPEDVGEPSPGLPYPAETAPAAYPVTGRGEGRVLIELQVGSDGRAERTKVVESAGSAFDAAALETVAHWRFRSGAPGTVFVVVGYREPSLGQPSSPQRR